MSLRGLIGNCASFKGGVTFEKERCPLKFAASAATRRSVAVVTMAFVFLAFAQLMANNERLLSFAMRYIPIARER